MNTTTIYSQFFIIFSIIITLNSVQCFGDFTFPSDNIDSKCVTKNGHTGLCVVANDCPDAINDYKTKGIQPTLCYFTGKVPVFCCANVSGTIRNTKRISAEKCEDVYSPLVPVSLPDDGSFHIAVAGGLKTAPGEFPHMAALGWKLSSNEIDWRCGGSLISENYVLTAAHCTPTRGDRPNIIRIGEKNLHEVNQADPPNDFEIENIIVHPEYRRSSRYNDIALIKLRKSVHISLKVRPACLWQDNFVNFTDALVTGYGHISYGGNRSDGLLKADLKFVENELCKKDYPREASLKLSIVDSQICAGDVNAIKDTCQGDSGGPLQVLKTDDLTEQIVYHIIGVTSFGKACAVSTPGVYTRVSSYLDWIESIVWP